MADSFTGKPKQTRKTGNRCVKAGIPFDANPFASAHGAMASDLIRRLASFRVSAAERLNAVLSAQAAAAAAAGCCGFFMGACFNPQSPVPWTIINCGWEQNGSRLFMSGNVFLLLSPQQSDSCQESCFQGKATRQMFAKISLAWQRGTSNGVANSKNPVCRR